MAIMRLSAMVGGISGKLGGMEFVQSRYGMVARKVGTKTEKGTGAQLAARARHEQVVRAWAERTEAEREAWRAAAAGTTFANRLGVQRCLTGFGLFVRVHVERWNSIAIFANPPRVMSRLPSPTAVGVTASAGGDVRVQWTHTLPALTGIIVVAGARPVSDRPRTFFRGWRNLVVFGKVPGTYNEIITTGWDDVLGHPVQGEVVAVRVSVWGSDYLRSFGVLAQVVTGA